jgi:hypothetical protein
MQYVALSWGQLLALLFLATLPWIAVGFWLGRLTRTDRDGVERLVFPVDDAVDPHAAPTPRRRYTDQAEP